MIHHDLDVKDMAPGALLQAIEQSVRWLAEATTEADHRGAGPQGLADIVNAQNLADDCGEVARWLTEAETWLRLQQVKADYDQQ